MLRQVRTLADKYTQPAVCELLVVAQGLCSGLAYLHQHRVVLCNLALRNALLASANVAKVSCLYGIVVGFVIFFFFFF